MSRLLTGFVGVIAACLGWAVAGWVWDDPEDRAVSAARARELIEAIREEERL